MSRQFVNQLLTFVTVMWLALWALVLTGCQTLPQPPEVVKNTITVYKPFEPWMVAEVTNDPPASQSVKAITESNNRRGELIDAVNCRLRLLAKLGKGETVNAGECKK